MRIYTEIDPSKMCCLINKIIVHFNCFGSFFFFVTKYFVCGNILMREKQKRGERESKLKLLLQQRQRICMEAGSALNGELVRERGEDRVVHKLLVQTFGSYS